MKVSSRYLCFSVIILLFSFLFQIQKVFAITSVITSASDFSASGEATNITVAGAGNSGSIKLSTTTIPVGDQYLLPITINNTGNSNNLYSNIVSFELNTATLITGGKMQSDCGDIRMRDSNKVADLLELNIVSCNTANTIISVKVPTIPASVSKIIYLYYGSVSPQTSISSTVATGTINLIVDADHLHGTAVDNGGGVVKLNTAGSSGHGQLSYGPTDSKLGINFDVSFDFSANGGCCNRVGAYATYFFAYNNSATPQGEDAVNGGYSINFDEYDGSPQGQIQLNYNGVLLKAVSKTGMSYSGYHTVRIKKTNTRFEVYFDGVKMMDYTDIVRNTSGQYYGFGSRNGNQTNTHLIKNMSMNDVFSTALPLPSVSVGTEEVATIPLYQDGVWTSSKLDYGIIGKWGDGNGGSEAIGIDISGLNSNRLVDIYMRTSSGYSDIDLEPFINIGSTISNGTFTKLTSDLNTFGLIAKEYVQFKIILSQNDGVSPSVDSITVNYINATIPEASTNLIHAGGVYDNFVFGWTPPVDDGGYIFDYKILYREPSVSSSWTSFTIGSPTTTYAFSNSFLPNHTHEFKVIAYNSAGEGVTSDIFSYTFPAPSNYNITSCSELQNINNDKYSSYTLTKDLNCSETSTWNFNGDIYSGFLPIGGSSNKFKGTFNGNNHTISGLYINRLDQDYIGLFGIIDSGASVLNLGLLDINIIGNNYVGALAGKSEGTTTKSYSTGTVNGYSEVGGLFGRTSNTSSINDSYSMINVTGYQNTGGFIGLNLGKIENSFSTGNISGYDNLGGFIGTDNTCGTCGVSNSFSTGNVSAGTNTPIYIGGFIGLGTEFNYKTGNGDSIPGNNYWFNTTQTVGVGDSRDESSQPTLATSINYFKGLDINTKAPFVDHWNFTDPIWYKVTNNYPAFIAEVIVPTVVESTPLVVNRSSSSGSSVQSRINNLQNMGNQKSADELIKQFPNIFVKEKVIQTEVLNVVYFLTKSNDLQFGVISEEVRLLQQFLNKNGYTVSISGPGSIGKETNVFGKATRAALIKFQKAKNISPAIGYFGPKTRAFIGK